MPTAFEHSVAALDADIKARPIALVHDQPEQTESLIPGENERPCFRVFEGWFKHDGAKLRPGVWYFSITPSKKKDEPPALTQQWICSPLYIEAVTTDEHGSNFGRQLRFKTTLGQWRTWAMPMELLRADGADLRGELLYMGLEIDPGQHQMLGRYLQALTPETRIRCVTQTGWATEHAFVLPAEVIGPDASGVVFQSGERLSDEYVIKGLLAEWQQNVAALAIGNPLLMLAICAAFAGPVLSRVNADSGGMHLVGDSSTGKTTAIDAACSVWGGPGFRRSWRATSNGMEGVAALFNDSLLALDEISECDAKEVGAIVYSLGNGRGKQRASRTGAARAVNRWRCSVLSTGERTIGTSMAEGGYRQKAGQTVRLLDVPAQRTYGAWDDLHGYSSGAAFSDALKNACKAHHGHAGPQFLRALTGDADTDFSEALQAIKAVPQFVAAPGDGQAARAAERFAVLALAGELAAGYGVAPWRPGQPTQAAAECFRAWLAQRGTTDGNLERTQVLEKIQGFIERHGDSRFSAIDADPERAMLIRDRAGWHEHTTAGRIYLFTASGMKEALTGFDLKRGLDVLEDVGALPKPGADGKRSILRRISGDRVRVYTVNTALLGT